MPRIQSTKLNGNFYFGIYLRTRSLPVLTIIYNMFYLNGKKVIPKNIYQYLDEKALAF